MKKLPVKTRLGLLNPLNLFKKSWGLVFEDIIKMRILKKINPQKYKKIQHQRTLANLAEQARHRLEKQNQK